MLEAVFHCLRSLVRRVPWLRGLWRLVYGGVQRLRRRVSAQERAHGLAAAGKLAAAARAWGWIARKGQAGRVVALTEYGRCCMQLGRHEEAVAALEEAVSLSGADGSLQADGSPALRLLAYAANERKDWAEAERRWRELAARLQKPQERSEALRNLALAVLRQKRPGEARAALAEVEAAYQADEAMLQLLAYVAIDEKEWPEAERRWRELAEQLQAPAEQEEKEKKSEALCNLALALSHQERFGEAVAALEEASVLHESVMVLRLLGQVAAEQRDWQQAMAHWRKAMPKAEDAEDQAGLLLAMCYGHWGLGEQDEALACTQQLEDFCQQQARQQSSHKQDSSHATEWEVQRHASIAVRARFLQKMARYSEVIDLIEALGAGLMWQPGPYFRKFYIDSFIRPEVRGDGKRLVASCEGGFLSSRPTSDDHRLVEILIHCNRFHTARQTYARCFDAVAADYCFPQLLLHTGTLFHGEEKRHWYGRILDRAAAMQDHASNDLQQRRLLQAQLAAHYGLRDTAGFSEVARQYHAQFPVQGAEHKDFAQRLQRDSESMGNKGNGSPEPNTKSPRHDSLGKVFGIGLTRTATTSLNHALRTLGYNAVHFTNHYSQELLEARDIRLFDGLSDVPVAWQFESLYERYPSAAFIYTTRPIEQWRAGFLRHIHWYHDAASFADFRRGLDAAEEYPHGEALRQIYQSLYAPYPTPEAAYQAHEQRVREFFAARPEARFLELNIFASGAWEQLAGFLGQDAPEDDFPHRNRAAVKGIVAAVPPPPPTPKGNPPKLTQPLPAGKPNA